MTLIHYVHEKISKNQAFSKLNLSQNKKSFFVKLNSPFILA